jgi:diaminopimelate decarboxylase
MTSEEHPGALPLQALAEAAARWGTPVYVTHLDRAADHLGRYRAALPDALVAYAVKANPDPALLRRLVSEGAGCEVVSGVELQLARRAGCPPGRIVMNGVGRTDAELAGALAAGALVNAESLDDLAALLRLAGSNARIGVRLNPALDARTHPHLATGAEEAQFGIALSDLPVALDRIRTAGRRLTALGAHIGSGIGSAHPFVDLAARLGAARARAEEAGLAPEWIDVGGGLADAELLPGWAAALPRGRLICEPGRSLVADAGWLVTRVLHVQPRARLTYLVADAGMTELIRPMLYAARHPVFLVRPGAPLADRHVPVHLAGPVCEAGDVLARDLGAWLSAAELASSGPGALLAIGETGAYGAAMAMNYNGRLRAAQAVIDRGALRLSRRRETLEDLVARDAPPVG